MYFRLVLQQVINLKVLLQQRKNLSKTVTALTPAVFKDDDGKFYMYFGGIWGGQLQRWNNNKYDSAQQKTA